MNLTILSIIKWNHGICPFVSDIFHLMFSGVHPRYNVSEFNSFFRLKYHYMYNAAFCFIIYPNVDAHLNCYHLVAIGHNAVMSLNVQIIFPHLYFQFFGSVSVIRVAGLYGNFVFIFF